MSFHLPSNEAEYIKGQVEYGKGSKGDKEEHNSETPPSPDGQTGLKHTTTDTWKPLTRFKMTGDSLGAGGALAARGFQNVTKVKRAVPLPIVSVSWKSS